MKSSKSKLEIIIVMMLIILSIALIVMCFLSNGKFINVNIDKASISQQQENTVTVTDISKWDLEKVNIVYDTDNVPVPVPKGYVASAVDGEHTVNTGFVIYEGEEPVNGLPNEEIGTYSTNPNSAWVASCTRNQWVWIPVPDSSTIYERDEVTGKAKGKLYDFSETGMTSKEDYFGEPSVLDVDNEKNFAQHGMQGMTQDNFLQELEREFELTISSIETYGGFYLGRYETGDISLETPVVKRINNDISGQTWYSMYQKMKKIGTNENIQTSMIFGCLWDEVIRWFIDVEARPLDEILVDSRPWGNYSEMIFQYTLEDGSVQSKTRSEKIPTGSTERNKANNIYDMAGNVVEWTLDGFISKNFGSRLRYSRGGTYYFTNDENVYERVNNYPGNKPEYYGFRAYLYIK